MRYFDLVETPQTGKTFLEDGESRIKATDSRVSVYFQSIDKVKYDRAFDDEGYPILLEYALQEDGTRYSTYLAEPDGEGVYQVDEEAISCSTTACRATKAKECRDASCEADIEVYGVVWQVDSVSRGLMRDGVYTYECLNALETAKDVEDRVEIPNFTNWILSDNTIRFTSVEELSGVLCAYSIRVNEIFSAYNTWREGDCSEEFSL